MKDTNTQKSCCEKEQPKTDKKGFWSGILYGIMPHTFCIAFIIFTILGTTVATTLLKPLLLNPYFFYILVGISFLLATVSAIIYLKRNGTLSVVGAKKSWKYLSILYGTTIAVNLILFMVIFPLTANIKPLNASVLGSTSQNLKTESLTLEVQIPCTGHAPLITGELNKIQGVQKIEFRSPNLFDIVYDPQKTSKEKILSLDVFNTYKAKVL
jgi:hypothetical protein